MLKEGPKIVSQKKERLNNVYYLKDNFCTKEFKTTASSKFLENFFPGYNSNVVELLQKENYYLCGKTILDELSCGGTGLLASTGPIYNPCNKRYLIGGSSSGSAWVVHEKLSSFSLGSDTGGSVRSPASNCGILGFKPSYGEISRLGLIPMSSLLDTVGIFSKRMDILKKVYKVLNVPDYLDLWTVVNFLNKKIKKNTKKKKEIAIVKGIDKFLRSSKKKELYWKAIEEIKKRYNVVEISIPNFIKENIFFGWIHLCFTELVSHLNSLQGVTFGVDCNISVKEKRTEFLGSTVKERLIIGTYILAYKKKELNKMYQWRIKLEKWVKKVFKKYIFFIFPTIIDNVLVDDSFLSLGVSQNWEQNLILISNLSRTPSISIPFGFEEIPFGLNVNCDTGNEEEMFDFCEQIMNSHGTN